MAKDCITCPKLIAEDDGAGGGTYQCADHPGIILGEWGHWVVKIIIVPLCENKEGVPHAD